MAAKVLIFTSSGCGGSERIALTITKILSRYKIPVQLIVYVSKISANGLLAYLSPDLPVTYINDSPGRSVRAIWNTIRLIKQEKPDYVFSSNGLISCILILLSFFFRHVRTIIRQDSMPQFINLRRARRFLYPHANVLIAQTEEMKDEMVKIYRISPQKIRVLYNPVDADLIREKSSQPSPFASEDDINYVAVGRVDAHKDYITLVNAFIQVAQILPNAHLYVCGNMYDKDYMQNINTVLQQNKPYSDSIHFVGFTDNPYRYMKYCDCFVLSSVHEGCPNVLLEAMSLHKPVVATQSVPFVSRVIQDGKNGYSVPIKSPDLLAQAMISARKLTISDRGYCADESVWCDLFE